MADHRSAKALAAAERLFKRKPDADTEEFRKVCERADQETISKLTNREFNASYVLPFRRSAALKGKPKKTKTTKKKATKKTKRRTKAKAAKTKTTRKKRGRPAARTTGDLSAERRIAQLIRERDEKLLQAAGDAMKVYHIASKIDEFAAALVSEASS